jgi:hypothetical protein
MLIFEGMFIELENIILVDVNLTPNVMNYFSFENSSSEILDLIM